jgi:hypothetical protein
MQRAPALYADNRISLVRYHINSVFEKCFSSKNAVQAEKFNEPIEPSLFRLIQDDQTVETYKDLVPDFSFFKAKAESAENQEEKKDELRMSEARQTATTESALIVVHWIG